MSMETTPDFNAIFKEILLGNGVSMQEHTSSGEESKRDDVNSAFALRKSAPNFVSYPRLASSANEPIWIGRKMEMLGEVHTLFHAKVQNLKLDGVHGNVCPEHSSYALPSLTMQNHGCKSCAELNKSNPSQPLCDKPLWEQTSHDKPLLEQALYSKLLVEQLKQSSGRVPFVIQRGFSHSPTKAGRGNRHAEGQQPNKLQEKVCPEHSCYALPSLTLQNHGCKSCAMMNSAEKGSTIYNRGKSQFKQTKQFSGPFKERTHDSQRSGEHNHHGFYSQSRMPRGKHYFQGQRPNKMKDDTRELLEIMDLSRNFYKKTSLGRDTEDFNGTGVNPYCENSPGFEKYVDDINSSGGSRYGLRKSPSPRGHGNWKPHSAKYNCRGGLFSQ